MICMLNNEYNIALARRQELLEVIAQAADEIAAIDRRLPILKSIELENILLRAEEQFVKECV